MCEIKNILDIVYDEQHPDECTFKLMPGYSHCGYICKLDESGEYIYLKMLRDFILNKE